MCMIRVWFVILVTSLFLMGTVNVQAEEPSLRSDDSREVMQIFNDKAEDEALSRELADEKKHKILFFMGTGLLVLLFSTAYFGISMVVFNKKVFVPHMVSAGLTITLGLAHAVTAMVWFFPF